MEWNRFLIALTDFDPANLEVVAKLMAHPVVGSNDSSRSKGRGYKPPHRYTRWKWFQSHTDLINTPSLVLPWCFKGLLTDRVLGSKKVNKEHAEIRSPKGIERIKKRIHFYILKLICLVVLLSSLAKKVWHRFHVFISNKREEKTRFKHKRPAISVP